MQACLPWSFGGCTGSVTKTCIDSLDSLVDQRKTMFTLKISSRYFCLRKLNNTHSHKVSLFLFHSSGVGSGVDGVQV